MTESVKLYGYHYSVYTRVVRIALYEKNVEYSHVEIDPFSECVPADFLKMNPFSRVPVFSHDGFTVYETAAITHYVDAVFCGPALMPIEPRALARVAQVLSIVDSYGYWPLVRQVFSHSVFRAFEGEQSCKDEVASGLKGSHRALTALETISAEGLVLNGERMTLADCHLAPMVDYFVRSEEGAKTLRLFPSLVQWWSATAPRESIERTDPGPLT